LDELRLCLVTDRAQTRGRDLLSVVRECLAAGLPAVQLREKDLGAAELAGLGRALREGTTEHGAALIINDRVDVALAVGADLEEAIEAAAAGADWIVFGPVYDTPAKRAYGPPQGLRALERVSRGVKIPVIAIGGITPERVGEVRRAGAHGVAAISAILAAASPAAATRRFLDALSVACS
jgi:thiamine-phosphate pyrophosphorylase